MTKIHHEPQHTGEYLLSEANGKRSREQGILAEGKLPAGAVLAKNSGGDYIQLDAAGSAPKNKAVAILYAATDATEDPARCVVHARDCEVSEAELQWPEGITEAQQTTATNNLKAEGIILR